MIREAVEKIVGGQNLTFEEAKTVMNEIMSGKTSETMISAYLVALRMKGETIDEISGSAQGMRDNAVRLEHDMDVLEIVGTGGDRSNTFNISTTSAFVVAAAGCKVAKHGNRGVSSKSGAADMLEALERILPSVRKEAEKYWIRWDSAFCLHRNIILPCVLWDR